MRIYGIIKTWFCDIYIFLGQHLDEINSGKISTKYDKYTVISRQNEQLQNKLLSFMFGCWGGLSTEGGGRVAIHALGPGNRQFPL